MKIGFNYLLCVSMVIIIALCGFGGYLLGDNINLNSKSQAVTYEETTDKYEASAMILIRIDDTNNKHSVSAADISDTATTLVENVKLIFSYSEELIDLIPDGYTLDVKSVNNTSVLKLIVTGDDPVLTAKTVNAIRDKVPEVFSKFFADAEATPWGDHAAKGTPVVENVVTEYKEDDISPVSCAVVGIIIGFAVALTFMIIDTLCRYKALKKADLENTVKCAESYVQ